MKLLLVFAATATAIGCCSAFTATNHLAPSFVDMSQLRMSSLKEGEEEPAAADTPQATTSQPSVAAVPSSPPGEVLMSTSLPFLERPSMLDGSLVGDVGFDPLGFAQTTEDYHDSNILSNLVQNHSKIYLKWLQSHSRDVLGFFGVF